ncbi:MAG: cytochrome P450, partial [Ktedonobacteraceae bacterium]
MSNQEKVLYQPGETSAPLPPVAEPQDMTGPPIQMYVRLYEKLGPVFRVPQGEQTLTILAGPEANVLVGRHGHEILASRAFWEDFGKALAGERNIGLATERDGEANRVRRAKSSGHYSRTKFLDQIPLMVEMVREHAQTWPQGERVAILPLMQHIVAEQLGQLLVHHEVGDYLPDFVTFLDTAIANALMKKNAQAFRDPAFVRAKARTRELGRFILAKRRAEETPSELKPDLLDHMLADAAEHPELYTEEQLEQASVGPFL